jgi:hypothetical protein
MSHRTASGTGNPDLDLLAGSSQGDWGARNDLQQSLDARPAIGVAGGLGFKKIEPRFSIPGGSTDQHDA